MIGNQSFNNGKRAKLSLRIGLAIAFGYAGIGSLTKPDVWVGYLPVFISKLSFAPAILTFFAIFELGLAVWLLSGWKVKYAAILAGIMLLGIVTANISDLTISFRDLALIFAAAALALLS
jgi:uncharacterized membrane protein YphA (DoxX/SURF4 family)